jgi:type IV pilus assembly protein PilX
MALMTSILLLIVLTIMALSMMRSYGIEERIAGNTRDKQRALNAAISAQQFAEIWLTSGVNTTTATCAGPVQSTVGQVCNVPLTNLNSLPWANRVTYTNFQADGGNSVTASVVATGGTQGAYAAPPAFYIADMGIATYGGNTGELYQINAVGYGGAQSTVAIVESTYFVSSKTAQDPTQP